MTEGIVIKAVGNLYTVRTVNKELVNCFIKGNLRIKGLKSTNPVTVGDKVYFKMKENSDKGQIIKVADRKNYVIRKSTNLSKQYHIIAANVDQAILVVSVTEPETPTEFIDRYLVACEAYRIPAIIIFNKFDLYKNELLNLYQHIRNIYESIGYKCLETSVTENFHIADFRNLLSNKISVLNGYSGVGKSSLIKAIAPDFDIKIGEISDYHKMGMHTTSYSEMYEIFENSFIIDTPGIKGFGLVDIEKNELFHFFPEIFKLSTNCKYYNCTHVHEPGCAVIEAVRNHEIALSRYNSYINIYFDENEKYRYS